jgi:hypothetical protein
MGMSKRLVIGFAAVLALLAAAPATAAQHHRRRHHRHHAHRVHHRHHAYRVHHSASDLTVSAQANARLADAVDTYAAGLGVPRSSRAAIDAAGIPANVTNALADELEQLHACDLVTQSNIDVALKLFGAGQYGTGLPLGQPAVDPYPVQRQGSTVLGFPVPPAPNPPVYQQFPFQAQVQQCGEDTVSKLDALKAALQSTAVPASAALDLWPVLSFQPGAAGHHTYANDYVLLVDEGSYNTFLNNAGGSGIDVWRGPAGENAPVVAPARGCIDAFDIIRQHTCTLASAALLELGSHNSYGRLQTPDPQTDGVCTSQSLEPRVFVQGTGVLGVGVLIDEGSENTYIGKVLTDGTGHVGGYGYLRDDGDNNSYTVIRDGLGDAVVGGIGTLIANGSGNTYTTYMPAPIDPTASAGTYGSGGVVDDLNNCDAGTGTTLGAGEVAGVGVFTAVGGHNSYNAPQDSLGSGLVAGKGTFSDTGSGGTDVYSGPGVVGGRGTGATVAPTSTNDGTFTDS